MFKLTSPFFPSGSQPEAIEALTKGIQNGLKDQVLLGVTGSGKTYTLANVIAGLNWPTLIISHNKTLAAQLYQEFKSFFPENAVSYFVSYYDYYQPEAYMPHTDTYIDKETEVNEELDKLRLAATTNIMTRNDTIVVASVSCIYNIGSPDEYERVMIHLKTGMTQNRENLFERLIDLQYERSDYGFHRGSFRVRGDMIDIFPAYEDSAIRIEIDTQKILNISKLNPVSGKKIDEFPDLMIYPAKHYMTDPQSNKEVIPLIRDDLDKQIIEFRKKNKLVEAQRLGQRVSYDLEMIEQMGYVNGIENYSRYFDRRNPGDPPYTLFDYYQKRFGDRWLLCIDESHMTIPQLRGMYHGDRSRKTTLIEYGFRLPAALDNRPMRFDEMLARFPQTIYVSATPDSWEILRAQECARNPTSHILNSKKIQNTGIVEQLVRPTGLVDPEIEIKPVEGQIDDLMLEIQKRVAQKERVLVTTLTKRMAEDLTKFLSEKSIHVQYLHSDIQTLERSEILASLRRGEYDVVIGINLLREGLDLPEVSLVAILDADKAGFLRSTTALVQTMGRAARHVAGKVIMYADSITPAMKSAIDEVERRRAVQLAYNKTHGIMPQSISKPIRDKMIEGEEDSKENKRNSRGSRNPLDLDEIDTESLTPFDTEKLIKKLTGEMRLYARELDFEKAAQLRDYIQKLRNVS